jgi:hypothetical protein
MVLEVLSVNIILATVTTVVKKMKYVQVMENVLVTINANATKVILAINVNIFNVIHSIPMIPSCVISEEPV